MNNMVQLEMYVEVRYLLCIYSVQYGMARDIGIYSVQGMARDVQYGMAVHRG